MNTSPKLDCATPNDRREYRITQPDRPVCCPPLDQCLWNSHPRVYLALDATGKARCPYCSAVFIREDATADG